MCLRFYNIVTPTNETDGPKAEVETHWMTDCVNNALFPTLLISPCKHIPEMTSLPAEALERMISSLIFALPYNKKDKIKKKQINIHLHSCVKSSA